MDPLSLLFERERELVASGFIARGRERGSRERIRWPHGFNDRESWPHGLNERESWPHGLNDRERGSCFAWLNLLLPLITCMFDSDFVYFLLGATLW